MRSDNKKFMVKISILLLSIMMIAILPIQIVNSQNGNQKIEETTFTEEWIDAANFGENADDFWYSDTIGDNTDVSSEIINNQAEFTVIGENYEFSEINGVPNASSGWVDYQPDVTPPQVNGTDDQGLWASHTWDERYGGQPYNTPHIQWRKDINMPVNMSDYKITSASLSMIINATVGLSVDIPFEGDQGSEYDSVEFYTYISDLEENRVSPKLSSYTADDLGEGDTQEPGTYDYLNDTYTVTVDEIHLIHYLETILQTDNYNFTMILGIDIYCDDNIANVDYDEWTELRIKSVNLTFTYAKKIDQFTQIAFKQTGDKLEKGDFDDIRIENSTLNFKYKVIAPWTSDSPNSEIRTSINNNYHTENIKLTTATTQFQDAKIDADYDITGIIQKDVNLSLGIEIYLADSFVLEDSLTIVIDDISFFISYTLISVVEIPEPLDLTPVIWLLLGIIGSLVAGFTSYLYYFRYPPMVRMMRRLERKIRRGSDTNAVSVQSRDAFIASNLGARLAIITPELKRAEVEKISTARSADAALLERKVEPIQLSQAASVESTPAVFEKAQDLQRQQLVNEFSAVSAGMGATLVQRTGGDETSQIQPSKIQTTQKGIEPAQIKPSKGTPVIIPTAPSKKRKATKAEQEELKKKQQEAEKRKAEIIKKKKEMDKRRAKEFKKAEKEAKKAKSRKIKEKKKPKKEVKKTSVEKIPDKKTLKNNQTQMEQKAATQKLTSLMKSDKMESDRLDKIEGKNKSIIAAQLADQFRQKERTTPEPPMKKSEEIKHPPLKEIEEPPKSDENDEEIKIKPIDEKLSTKFKEEKIITQEKDGKPIQTQKGVKKPVQLEKPKVPPAEDIQQKPKIKKGKKKQKNEHQLKKKKVKGGN